MRAVRPRSWRARGFTLVELIITLAVAAIVLTAATPSFSALVEKQRLAGTVAQLVSDLRFAHDEAMRRGENIRVVFQDTRGCYVMHTGTVAPRGCTCTDDGKTNCTPGASALKVVGLGPDSALRLTTTAATFVFGSLHGTVSPGSTVTLTGGSGRSIKTTVDSAGRVRTCSPSIGTPAVPGYSVC